MTIDETYNIHKIINCIFRKFKSKYLCKRNIHNYRINPSTNKLGEWNWKCYCCGKEIEETENKH